MTTARDTGCETNFSDLDLRECTAFYTHTFQTSCRPDICPVLYLAAWCNITALTRELVDKILPYMWLDKNCHERLEFCRIEIHTFLQQCHACNEAATVATYGGPVKTF